MFKKASFTISMYKGARGAKFHKLSYIENSLSLSLCSSAIFILQFNTVYSFPSKHKAKIDELKPKSQHLEKKKKKNPRTCNDVHKKASCFGDGADRFSQVFSVVKSFLAYPTILCNSLACRV